MTIRGRSGVLDHAADNDQSESSASRLIPELLGMVHPASVVDVGCGVGGWLATFRSHGIENCLGIDQAVMADSFMLEPHRFHAHDLMSPLDLERRFDLVVSLEVAEHIPGEFADVFIDTLTGLGDLVVFSGAAPHQPGPGHTNCQWPDYWATKFAARGFVPHDTLRFRFWEDTGIAYWYRQNMVLYGTPERFASLGLEPTPVVRLVQPELYEWMARPSAQRALAVLISGVRRRSTAGLSAFRRLVARSARSR